MVEAKTADKVTVGDIIVTKDKGEHLVLFIRHSSTESKLRTVNLQTGEPKNRVWKHSRIYTIDVSLSAILQPL